MKLSNQLALGRDAAVRLPIDNRVHSNAANTRVTRNKISLDFLQRLSIFLLALALLTLAGAARVQAEPPLANAVVLIVRHGEKPADGPELAPAGQERARQYVGYFEHFTVDGKPVHIDYLIATADSKHSFRERLTLTPLSQATHIPIDTRFKNKDVDDLASALSTEKTGKVILICWHHEKIADMLTALGVDPSTVIPGGKWPGSVFNWVIELRYDANGHLIPQDTKRVVEHLMPGDK